jgi:hypothetical protein
VLDFEVFSPLGLQPIEREVSYSMNVGRPEKVQVGPILVIPWSAQPSGDRLGDDGTLMQTGDNTFVVSQFIMDNANSWFLCPTLGYCDLARVESMSWGSSPAGQVRKQQ